jgi:hypothetical protein
MPFKRLEIESSVSKIAEEGGRVPKTKVLNSFK